MTTMSALGAASATSAYRSPRRPPELAFVSALSRQEEIRRALWPASHCAGVPAVHAASTSRETQVSRSNGQSHQPCALLQRRQLLLGHIGRRCPSAGGVSAEMNLVFGVEQRRIAVRAPQALIVVCEAPALSRGIRVAQRNILADADSICGGRQRADSQDSGQAGNERGHKTRQEAPPPSSHGREPTPILPVRCAIRFDSD